MEVSEMGICKMYLDAHYVCKCKTNPNKVYTEVYTQKSLKWVDV